MNRIFRNIRKNSVMVLLKSILFVFILNFGTIMLLLELIKESSLKLFIILIIISILAVFFDIIFIKNLILVINPYKASVFKKYGSVEDLEKILSKIDKTKIYEDKNLIISNDYIMDKKSYSNLISCKDVLGVYRLVHKTNFIVDYYGIVIKDKYGEEVVYRYNIKKLNQTNEVLNITNEILNILMQKCKNAKFGYTSDTLKYAKENEEELPNMEKEDLYECPDCGKYIKYKTKKCKNCGCNLDWSDIDK